ncbi:MAG: hypothetical protein JKY34_03200 [Kordiimonadaceae bacterium]|nr:hypothetical protein [Kordiimonadaceae bacterium]
MKQWILKHPFWAFYVVAISFPTVLFTYVISLEIYFQGLNGADYSFLANFMTLKAGLLERYPVLFHHKDSVVLYMSAYVLVPLGMPMLFFPFHQRLLPWW